MKIVCPQCKREVSNEFNQTLTFCTHCGASLKISENPSPRNNGQFRTIFLTSLFTSLFLLTIFGAGIYLYWNYEKLPPPDKKTSENIEPIFSPQKERLAVSVDEVTKIELRIDTYQKNAPISGAVRMLGNISLSNVTWESKTIIFYADGRAEKLKSVKKYDAKANAKDVENSKYEGVLTIEQFRELAALAVKNDFFNLPYYQKDVPTIGTSVLKIYSAKSENSVKINDAGSDPPPTADIAQAVKKLESQIDWKPVQEK